MNNPLIYVSTILGVVTIICLVAFLTIKDKKEAKSTKIIVGQAVYSEDAEGYNRLKDNILYIKPEDKSIAIQIESSLAHEGKTTVACNLAVSLGFTEKKVVIVDLDFLRPRTHRVFRISKQTGIAEYMIGAKTKQEIIKPTGYKNVDIITRGEKVYNPTLVLVSDKFKKLIEELREEYDYVILDCAPVLLVSDYIHISKVSDSVLFLVAYGSTTKSQVADAIKELKKNNIKILGTVFSMYDRKRDKSYGLYGYKNRYYKYYDSYAQANKYLEAEDEDDIQEEIENQTQK